MPLNKPVISLRLRLCWHRSMCTVYAFGKIRASIHKIKDSESTCDSGKQLGQDVLAETALQTRS